MGIRVLAAALLLAPLAASAVARAQPCTPQLVGADRRGPVDRIARTGSRFFLAAGAALVVVDAADPVAPTERGYVNLDGVVRDVAAWGWTVVAVTPEGLTVVDASDPDRPRVAGVHPLPAGSGVGEVAVGDGIAYYPAPDGLHVVDLHDPAHPTEIGLFAVAGASDVALRLDRAYLLAGGDLLVLDISNPAAPSEVASVPAPGDAIDHVTVGPGGAYLATWGTDCFHGHCSGDAALFDLDEPDLPVERSVIPSNQDSPMYAVALGGGNLYLNEGWRYGAIYGIADPARPVLVGTFTGEHLGQMTNAPDPGFLFAADRGVGLRVYDVTPPSNTRPVASVAMPSATLDGYFSGSLAVTIHEQGVRVFDLADPRRPNLVGSWSDPGESLLGEVARVGEHAYAPWDHSGFRRFRIFDLSDPLHPALAGAFGEGLRVEEAPVVLGDLLIAPGVGLHLFNVTDPVQPVEIGTVLPGDSVFYATGAGERAYAWTADVNLVLHAFDVSVPQAPIALGSTSMERTGRSLAYGLRLFVNDYDEFRVYDVSDPSNAALEGSLSLPARTGYHRIALYGSRVALGPNGPFTLDDRFVRLLDVSDPAQPFLVAELDTRGDPRNAFAGPGLIGIADGAAGFAVYESCVPFADGFESGGASAWSVAAP